MSKWGIRLPAPKLSLPEHLQSESDMYTWLKSQPSSDIAIRAALPELVRAWRIERSRADHLEEIVEKLESELRRSRRPSVIFRFWAFLTRKNN